MDGRIYRSIDGLISFFGCSDPFSGLRGVVVVPWAAPDALVFDFPNLGTQFLNTGVALVHPSIQNLHQASPLCMSPKIFVLEGSGTDATARRDGTAQQMRPRSSCQEPAMPVSQLILFPGQGYRQSQSFHLPKLPCNLEGTCGSG